MSRRWDAPRITVLVTALLSAIAAITLSSTVFSHLSVNNDEAVYLMQAKAIAHGHLFPPAPHPAGSFTPWLGVVDGSHYVLKYVPVLAGFLALSLAITGGYAAGIAVIAAGLVGATYLLAREITGQRAVAATAAVLLAASPVVLLQSAMLLPYVFFLVLAQIALWALLAGDRRASWRLVAFGALVGGLAAATRPLDTVLLFLPISVWLLWRSRDRRRLLLSASAGLVLPLAGLLWFDTVATGSAFKLPFSLFSSGDTVGFGVHRMYPGEVGRNFGIVQGWQGLWRHLSLLGGGWMLGGLLLLVPVAVALKRRRYTTPLLALLAGAGLFLVGYLCFWGTWNAGIVWGAVRYLGPYYMMPVLVPVCILAALGMAELLRGGRWRPALFAVLAVAVSAAALGPALGNNATLNAANGELARTVAAQGKALVFVDTYPNYLQHPTAVISNDVPVGGRTVYALPRGGDDFAVVQSFPDRPLYRLRLRGEYGRRPHSFYGGQLNRMAFTSGQTLAFRIRINLPSLMAGARFEIRGGAMDQVTDLPPVKSTELDLRLGPAGQPGIDVALPGLQPGGREALTLVVYGPPRQGQGKVLDRLTLPIERMADGSLRTLAPSAVVAQLGPMPPPTINVSVAAGSPVQ